MKGQKARAGNKQRPEMRDIIKKLPKRRGYGRNRARGVNSGVVPASVVNVSVLEKMFDAGATINPSVLKEKGLIKNHGGKLPVVKILGNGTLTKKFTFEGVSTSAATKEKIEKVGGTI